MYKLFNKYETKFGRARLQRTSQTAGPTGKKRTAWGKIYGATASDSFTPLASASAPAIVVVSELSSYLDSDIVTCFVLMMTLTL